MADRIIKVDLTPRRMIRVDFPRTVNTGASGEGGGVTDHGGLTGLSDDDHAQYHNNARGDARYPLKSANLSDLASAATARTNLGLGTSDKPQFAGVKLSYGGEVWSLEITGLSAQGYPITKLVKQ